MSSKDTSYTEKELSALKYHRTSLSIRTADIQLTKRCLTRRTSQVISSVLVTPDYLDSLLNIYQSNVVFVPINHSMNFNHFETKREFYRLFQVGRGID